MKYLLILAIFNGESVEVVAKPMETPEACVAYVDRLIETSDHPFDHQCVDVLQTLFSPNVKAIHG